MSTSPLITAVILTFERPKLLERAIESVQAQTIQDLKILILDSASQDETESVAQRRGKEDLRISYYRHSKKVPAAENYQFGINQVKTPFFSFLADDDFLLPRFYERALDRFEHFPDAEFFIGSTVDASLDVKPISAEALKWPKKEFFHPKEGLPLVIRHYFNWTGSVFRTITAKKHSINAHVVPGDYDFILNLAARYPFAFSAAPCAVFSHHPASFSSHCGMQLIYPSFLQIGDAICQIRPKEERAFLEKVFHQTFLRKSLQIAIQNIIRDNHEELCLIRKAIQSADSQKRVKSKLPTLLLILIHLPILRTLFVKTYFCYRWLKRVKVQMYLKNWQTN